MNYKIVVAFSAGLFILALLADNSWVLPYITRDFEKPENSDIRAIISDTEQKLVQLETIVSLTKQAENGSYGIGSQRCNIYESNKSLIESDGELANKVNENISKLEDKKSTTENPILKIELQDQINSFEVKWIKSEFARQQTSIVFSECKIYEGIKKKFK